MAHPPLILTPVPLADAKRGDGNDVSAFIGKFCRITKESLGGSAGELLRLRPWQTNVNRLVYARTPNGRLRHREALIGLPRKNGKSALGSSFGLQGLIMGPEGAEVYSCAADKDQARIVFNVAKAMVERDEALSALCHVYRDAIEYTDNGSVYKVLSSEAFTKEGLNPTVVVYDELHAAPNDELYSVMSLAFGARRDPLLIVISTAGVMYDITGQESICYRRYLYGEQVASGEIDDPSFFMAWWGAPKGADYRDPKVHEAANPGYGDLIDPADFRSALGKVSENDFRTKRLNQWVSAAQAWLPQGAWESRRDDDASLLGGDGVVFAFDGSKTGDCTALIAVTVETNPVVKLLGMWERPPGAPRDWKVPRGEVKQFVREQYKFFEQQGCHCWEIAWDEFLWLDAAEELEDEGLPIVVFPQTLSRMGPATQRFYEMVCGDGNHIRHDGNPALARHLASANIKKDARGDRLTKDSAGSKRRIDAAVAAVMGVERAMYWLLSGNREDAKDQPGYFKGQKIDDIGFVW